MRTIIDILQKGNQELFHSTMIAWLLDPNMEHGLGRILLDGIAAKLDARGFQRFKQVLDSTKTVRVRTEVARSKSRYDIEISGGDSLIVLENKTKSCGEEPQFEDYIRKNPDAILVALGLCRESFFHGVEQKYPLITYGDVLQILQDVPIPNNDWGILIKHYIRFLQREISFLELIIQCYEKGDISKHGDIVEIIKVGTENDSRFLNLFLLEKFHRRLKSGTKFDGFEWHSNKNQISGVWLASYFSQPRNYNFTAEIETLQRNNSAELWFHIELGKGIGAEVPSDIAGTFQLRVSVRAPTEVDNFRLLEEFSQIRNLRPDEDSPKKVKKSAGTFYLVSKKIYKQDLILDNLEKNFTEFCERFGAFRQ